MRRKILIICIFGFVLLGGLLTYFLWLQPKLNAPLSPPLQIPRPQSTVIPKAEIQENGTVKKPTPTATADTRISMEVPQTEDVDPPVCGDQREILVLLVGMDYRGEGYLYGLADVIRIVRVDFTIPRVNIVALPRAMLVEVPEDRLSVEDPILLNQAYLFGSPGMQHYLGSADGAGALAETIQYNFGITVDHYLVLNFKAFVEFVDALGGIEVDLPQYVDDRPDSYFPAGKQTLSGEEALDLARVRRKYSDLKRIDYQTIVMKAIFQRMKEPEIITKLPKLIAAFEGSVLTDVSPKQIQQALCLLGYIKMEDLFFYSPEDDIVKSGWVYIPTMNQLMDIYHWDETFIKWLTDSLWEKPAS